MNFNVNHRSDLLCISASLLLCFSIEAKRQRDKDAKNYEWKEHNMNIYELFEMAFNANQRLELLCISASLLLCILKIEPKTQRDKDPKSFRLKRI